jgi:transcriptional regulator with XRE-family HTH domain
MLEPDELSERIREELGRRRVTRQWLADEARISLSTLEKALAGQRRFTTATLVRIEEALGLSLRPRRAFENEHSEIAQERLGAYSRPAVRGLEGDYLTVRPAFMTEGALVAYRTSIAWDEEGHHLVFRESERADSAYTQRGDVAMPHQSGHVYLVTQEAGQYRLAILGRPNIDGSLCGLLTTLQAAGGTRLVPVSCPIVLLPLRDQIEPVFGLRRRGEEGYDMLANALCRVEGEGFMRLVGCPEI